MKRITDGKGCQAVLDMVGGDYVARNLDCLAEDGRHVSIAVLGGAKAEIFIPQIMQRRLTLTASTLRARSVGLSRRSVRVSSVVASPESEHLPAHGDPSGPSL